MTRPTLVGQMVVLAHLLVAIWLLRAPLTTGIAVFGATVLAAGALVGSRKHASYGLVAMLGAVVTASLEGVPAAMLVLATVVIVVAWDVATYSTRVATNVGQAGSTGRIELLHASYSLAVGLACTAVVLAAHAALGPIHSFGALAFFLIALFALTAALH